MEARTYITVVSIIGVVVSDHTSTASTSSRTERDEMSPLSDEDISLILDSHNRARYMEKVPGMPPLTWNSELALEAQKWTDQCNFEHQPASVRKWGENLAVRSNLGSRPELLTASIKNWVDEKDSNIGGTFEECCGPGGMTCCHYTQVIWYWTTTVGCGYSVCDNMDYGTGTPSNMVYLACYYSPAGNSPTNNDWRPYPTGHA